MQDSAKTPRTHEDIMYKLGEMHADIKVLKGVEPRVRSLETSRARSRGAAGVAVLVLSAISAKLLNLI